jgi:RNA polymerase sigma-70 factor (ECF subfamily)
MLGSSFEAEDAVQETMLRAWRNIDRFEGRSALKSWLYRIATNVCMDMLNGRQRRARPMELTEVGTPDSTLHTLPEVTWLEPIPDAHVLPQTSDPAELAQAQETLRLAFVATLQHLPGRQRRARPMELTEVGTPDSTLHTLPEVTWLEPIPDAHVLPHSSEADPAEVAQAQETLRLAFVAALQHLPPRQRAVLILREVLRWSAAETAELLDTSVVSVNSALQRARATIAATQLTTDDAPAPLEGDEAELLDRYVAAFEQYDIDSLVKLLHEDATLSMPPFDLWLRGREHIAAWHLGPGHECRGSRLIATSANGLPAFGQYRPSGPGGSFEPWALQVIEHSGGRITGLNAFLDTARMFPLFGLPAVPPED